MLIGYPFIVIMFILYNAGYTFVKNKYEKRKIIHFCEIVFTSFRCFNYKSFHRRNFGFRTGNFGFHRRNLNFLTGNFFREISFKYNRLRLLNTIICLITLTGSVPVKWHRLFSTLFYLMLWTASDCFIQSRSAADF